MFRFVVLLGWYKWLYQLATIHVRGTFSTSLTMISDTRTKYKLYSAVELFPLALPILHCTKLVLLAPAVLYEHTLEAGLLLSAQGPEYHK